MTNQKIGHTLILFIALFLFTEAKAQVQNFTYTDCNGNTESVFGIISQGKPLLIASKGFDCSICMSQAPAIQTFAAQNPNVRLWGAMNYKYSSSTPTCTQVNSWKNTYSWNDIFMFPDVNDEWQGVSYPTYYVISPVDSQIIYSGPSFSTATTTANSVILACTAPTLSWTVNAALCSGETGSATIAPTGGSAPYSYLWSNGETVSSIMAIAGTYTVTVTDSTSCAATQTVAINEPAVLAATLVSSEAGLNCNGTASAVTGGGTSPYNLLWNNGSVASTLDNLCTGWYSVTVTDANNCSKSDSVFVNVSTGINDVTDAENFSIYPNPAKDEIQLAIKKDVVTENFTVTVLNLLGEAVVKFEMTLPDMKINVRAFPSGIYFMNLRGKDIDETLKFVRE